MRKLSSCFLAIVLFACGTGYAGERELKPITKDLPKITIESTISDEIATLDLLIDATKNSLEGQKSLRQLILKYQETHNKYLQNPDDNECLLQLVRIGNQVFESIQENHLIHSFDPEFISEVSVFAQFANKRCIPKP